MNFIPKKSVVWALNENTVDTVQDYVPMTGTINMFSYFLYIILWLGSLHLLKLFNNKYDRTSIIMAFLIGITLFILLDWINAMTWEIAIDKDNAKYYIMNNALHKSELESNYRVMSVNNVYKMKKPNHKILLIGSQKYIKYLKEKKFTDKSFTNWRSHHFNTFENRSLDDIAAASKNIGAQIEVLMNSAYYVFTILITLSAVAYRVNRKLFNRIIPWVLSSAIVGLGSMFFMLWERKYDQLLMHLAFKKKLLITSMSFAMAACFIFLNNI